MFVAGPAAPAVPARRCAERSRCRAHWPIPGHVWTGHATTPYLSYAIPDDGARPTSAEGRGCACADACCRHDRLPTIGISAARRARRRGRAACWRLRRRGRLAVMTRRRRRPRPTSHLTTASSSRRRALRRGSPLRCAPPSTRRSVRSPRSTLDGGVQEAARRRQRLADGGLALLAATSPPARSSVAVSRPSRPTVSPRSPASAS